MLEGQAIDRLPLEKQWKIGEAKMIELDHTALVAKVLELQETIKSQEKALFTAVQITNTLEDLVADLENELAFVKANVK